LVKENKNRLAAAIETEQGIVNGRAIRYYPETGVEVNKKEVNHA